MIKIEQKEIVQYLEFLVENFLNNALTFDLSDDLGGNVIHMYSEAPFHLNLNIKNKISNEIQIVGQSGKASASNYHFHIQFANNKLFSGTPPLTLVTSGWSIYLQNTSSGFVSDIYLLSNQTIALSTTQTTNIKLKYTYAEPENAGVDVVNITVNVGENVEAVIGKKSEQVQGSGTVHVSTFTDANVPTPLAATLVEPKTILDDGTNASSLNPSLNLRVVNTSPDPVLFTPPTVSGGDTPTAIKLSVDLDENAAWALCKQDEAENINITPPTGWIQSKSYTGVSQQSWIFRPEIKQVNKIEPASVLEFEISNVQTSLPPGFTNLYIEFQEFPIYGTQTLVAQIEKSPLIYKSGANSGLVSQGTTGGNYGLELKGDTSDSLLSVEQSGTGNSAQFSGGSGVKADTVTITGNATCEGSVVTNTITSQSEGITVTPGNEILKVSGSLTVDDEVKTSTITSQSEGITITPGNEPLTVSGSLTVDDEVTTNTITSQSEGITVTPGNKSLTVNGSLTVNDDVATNTITSQTPNKHNSITMYNNIDKGITIDPASDSLTVKGPIHAENSGGAPLKLNDIPIPPIVCGAVYPDGSIAPTSKNTDLFSVDRTHSGEYTITFKCFTKWVNIVAMPYDHTDDRSKTYMYEIKAYNYRADEKNNRVVDVVITASQGEDTKDTHFAFFAMGE